jgi:hypothetical protein
MPTKKSTTKQRTKKSSVKKVSLARKLFKTHWRVFIVAAVLCIIAVIGAVSVLLWFIQTSSIGVQGSLPISQWSLATLLWFLFNLVLWELLFVGLPSAIIFGGGGYLWWNSLSPKDKQELKGAGNGGKGDSGNAFEFFFFIAYVIYILVDGNFHTPFGSLPYSYWVYAALWTMFWILILVGIPAGVIGLAYVCYYKKS